MRCSANNIFMTKRIFVSIPLPEEWRNAFADYCRRFPRNDVRWTAKENIHITACFLGDVQEERIGEIREKVQELCARTTPFTLSFEKIDFAPPDMPPRMVWVVFKESDVYARLVEEMRDALGSFFAVEPHKELIPHATLVRFKDPSLARSIDITQALPDLGSFDVRSVELMESRLDPAGVRYEKLETFPLNEHA